MTTKADIDAALHLHAGVAHVDLPDRYTNPSNEHDFNISVALLLASDESPAPAAGPVYDAAGELTGWQGIRLRSPSGG